MRGLEQIIAENSDNTIVLQEAIKRCDYDVVDLLSCGSGYDVTEAERIAYIKGGNEVFFGE